MTNYLQRISELSKLANKNHQSAFTSITWSKSINDDDQQYLWMPKELISLYHTEYFNKLSNEEVIELSKWECVNLFSLTYYGEADLIVQMSKVLGSITHPEVREFMHHFICEECEHMWFFSEFCQRYAGKMYTPAKISPGKFDVKKVDNFLVFARCIIFEMIGDSYNKYIAKADDVHPLIRQINKLHYQDEARHIAFGHQLLKHYWNELLETLEKQQVEQIQQDLVSYVQYIITLYYNPYVYKDAGIETPLKAKQVAHSNPEQMNHFKKLLNEKFSNLIKFNLLSPEQIKNIYAH